ncbi:hypothetical protein, partial [Cereibacter azotoformans]
GRAPRAASGEAAPAEGASDARPPRGDRPERQGHPRPKGKGGKPDRKGGERNQPKSFESRPARSDKIDPDNPFAVLAALRDRT